MLLITLFIQVIYLSTAVDAFDSTDPDFINTKNEVIFSLFMGGVFSSGENSQYWGDSYPYYIILSLLVIERMCLDWMTDRFHCNSMLITKFQLIESKYRELMKKTKWKD